MTLKYDADRLWDNFGNGSPLFNARTGTSGRMRRMTRAGMATAVMRIEEKTSDAHENEAEWCMPPAKQIDEVDNG
jgi:hypothetical protein